MDEDESKKLSTYFWNLLEEERGTKLPVYVKNICQLNRLDNPITFQLIDDKVISDLETFVRDSMEDFIEEGADKKLYYGNFDKKPDKFKFLIGDKYLLKDFAKFVKEKNDPKFWKPPKKTKSNRRVTDCQLPFDDTFNNKPAKFVQKLFPINVDSEKNEVTRLLKNLLMSLYKFEKSGCETKKENDSGLDSGTNDAELFDENDIESLPIDMEELNIDVSVQELYKGNELLHDMTYVLELNCYKCKQRIKITKVTFVGPENERKKARWILTNYSRHVKNHFIEQQTIKKRPGRKRKNNSVSDMLRSSVKKNKVETEADATEVDLNSISHEEDMLIIGS